MLISTIRLENKGLKKFFAPDNSDEDVSDFDGFEFGPAHMKKVADEFEGGRRKNNMDDDMSSSKRKNRSD